MLKMRILINTPCRSLIGGGGVASHYSGLQHYWNEKVKYNTVGKRSRTNKFSAALWLPLDILKFIFRILCFRPDFIVLNPSLSRNAIKRDMFYSKLAKLFNIKCVIMFHGFNVDNVKFQESKVAQWLNSYATLVLVLSASFKEWLEKYSVVVPIEITSTKVEDKLLDNFDVLSRGGCVNSILFLSRATKEKGLFIAIDVFKILASKYPSLKFRVVGGGPDLDAAIGMARPFSDRISFTGELKGEALINEFVNNDLYLFTSYHEGMPASVLEAMSFGLPVISRPVGALIDFFKDDKMGYLVDSFNPHDFIDPITALIDSPEKCRMISHYNYAYAKQNFYASMVAKQIEETLNKYSK